MSEKSHTHARGEHTCAHGHDSAQGGGAHIHPVVKNLWVAFFLNLAFTILEFIGGWFTNSVAILSDAVHDLGDSIAIGAALVLEKKSLAGRSRNYTYGKRRFSVLATVITSLVLVGGSVGIVVNAVPRFMEPQEVNSAGMFVLAILGIAFNGAAVLRLKRSKNNSLNQKAVMLHLLEDVLGWIAVCMGGVVMYFTDWYWIDPMLSLGIAAYVSFNAVRNLISASRILLQVAPDAFDAQKITEKLLKIPEVEGVHDMHCWTMDGEKNVLTLHVVTQPLLPTEKLEAIKAKCLHIIAHEGAYHTTLQMETTLEKCSLQDC